MMLITAQRVKDEKLEWQDIRVELEPPRVADDEILTYVLQSQIIDSEGNIYHGIIDDDGTVIAAGGNTRYDSVWTFHGFPGSEPSGLSKRFGIYNKTRHTMFYNPETRQVFAHAVHPSVSNDHYYSMDALDVAQWLSDVDNREEPVRYDNEPQSFAVGIPDGIVSAIEQHLDGNPINWVRCILAEALGDLQLAGSAVGVKDGAPAFTAEQVRGALKSIQETKVKAIQDPPGFSAAIEEAVQGLTSRRHRRNGRRPMTFGVSWPAPTCALPGPRHSHAARRVPRPRVRPRGAACLIIAA